MSPASILAWTPAASNAKSTPKPLFAFCTSAERESPGQPAGSKTRVAPWVTASSRLLEAGSATKMFDERSIDLNGGNNSE